MWPQSQNPDQTERGQEIQDKYWTIRSENNNLTRRHKHKEKETTTQRNIRTIRLQLLEVILDKLTPSVSLTPNCFRHVNRDPEPVWPCRVFSVCRLSLSWRIFLIGSRLFLRRCPSSRSSQTGSLWRPFWTWVSRDIIGGLYSLCPCLYVLFCLL